MKTPFLLLFLWFGGLVLNAQPITGINTGQKFLHFVEPIGLVLIEAIEPGMTLYGQARKYNVSLDSVLQANPDLDPQAIPLGYPLQIPIFPKAISITPPEGTDDAIPVYYRVQPKETLYRISRVYMGVSPETIVFLNPRASTTLSIGEVLLLGWYRPLENTRNPITSSEATASDSTVYRIKDFSQQYKTEGRTIREQKGLAVWKQGNDKTHYFVLHPTAIVGTYMEVTNPMLHRTLTAKVAGNIPPGIYQPHVGLVVSPSVARALGVLDQQFFARWRFVE